MGRYSLTLSFLLVSVMVVNSYPYGPRDNDHQHHHHHHHHHDNRDNSLERDYDYRAEHNNNFGRSYPSQGALINNGYGYQPGFDGALNTGTVPTPWTTVGQYQTNPWYGGNVNHGIHRGGYQEYGY